MAEEMQAAQTTTQPPPAAQTTAAAAQQAAAATTTNPPPPAAEAQSHAQTIVVPTDRYLSLEAEVRELRQREESRATEARAEQIRALTAKGDLEKALELQRSQAEATIAAERAERARAEGDAKKLALDSELSRCLASLPLLPGSPEQLTRLFSGDLQVDVKGGQYEVRSTSDFRPVSDYVTAQMAKAEYQKFLRPSNPSGGTGGSTGGHQSPPTTEQPAAPRSRRHSARRSSSRSSRGRPPRTSTRSSQWARRSGCGGRREPTRSVRECKFRRPTSAGGY